MIQSMTLEERADPNSLVREPSRVKRVARGSGQPPEGVSELIQKFLFMRQMMSGFGQDLGFMGNIPGLRNLAMARNAKKAMQGGFPGMGFPGMGFPGMGMPGMPGTAGAGDATPRMRVLSKAEKNAKKSQRKRERDARKKGKKR
jgi:signal recognition particle subunit SRP54